MNKKKLDIKIRMCYYFDDVMRIIDIGFSNTLLKKNYRKIFSFITFHTKLTCVQT